MTFVERPRSVGGTDKSLYRKDANVPTFPVRRKSPQFRVDSVTTHANAARFSSLPLTRMNLRRPMIAAGIAAATFAFCLPGSLLAAGEPVTPTTPPASPTGDAKPKPVESPFKADRTSSLPLGLVPDDVTKPFVYPDEPIVLTWSAVPGAVLYKVEVSSNPAFTDIDWSSDTDQTRIAPQALFPDGNYWWRVTATDAAGVVGLTSVTARFAKVWPSTIKNLRVSATPGGPAVTQTSLAQYFTWNPLPGAAGYDLEVAAGDQFGTPSFWSKGYSVPFMSSTGFGVLPDDTYRFRVRGRDAKGNPGPWSLSGQFTKQWVAAVPEFPEDDAVTHDLRLRWTPIEGAEKYQVQITDLQHNWDGDPLRLNALTPNSGIVPNVDDHESGISYGDLWWRVRPIVDGKKGGWSPVRHITYAPPAFSTPLPELQQASDSDTALMPELIWTPVTGADFYRVDIATDPLFHNLVESTPTFSTSWVSRAARADNQAGTGYYWRVIWGNFSVGWMVDESTVPTSSFKKQTKISLGLADNAAVSETPLLTWTPVMGAPKYEVEIAQDSAFDPERTKSPVIPATVWGLGQVMGAHRDNAEDLKEGTWFWRVRPVDGDGNGQTWSPVRQFTLSSPRPVVSAPEEGETVIGAPLMRWAPVSHVCGYDVQVSMNPSLETDTLTVSTIQTAIVLTKTQISQPGRWYWRVRTDRCDGIKGQWTPTRSFKSVLPPDFGLNDVPSKVSFGGKTVVVGALSFGGSRVKNPTLVLERRVWPETDFGFFGTVKGDAQGRFAFRIKNTRTTAYRLRWEADPTHPEGQAPFAIRVLPRVTLNVGGRKVARRGKVMVRGSVYPPRVAYLQTKISGGWETIRTLRLRSPRFAFPLKATLVPGRHRLRVLVPGDQRLATNTSKARSLFVYDRFVVKAGKGK